MFVKQRVFRVFETFPSPTTIPSPVSRWSRLRPRPPRPAAASRVPFSLRPLPLINQVTLYRLLWAQQTQQRALDEWHELAFALEEHGDVVVEGVVLAHLQAAHAAHQPRLHRAKEWY